MFQGLFAGRIRYQKILNKLKVLYLVEFTNVIAAVVVVIKMFSIVSKVYKVQWCFFVIRKRDNWRRFTKNNAFCKRCRTSRTLDICCSYVSGIPYNIKKNIWNIVPLCLEHFLRNLLLNQSNNNKTAFWFWGIIYTAETMFKIQLFFNTATCSGVPYDLCIWGVSSKQSFVPNKTMEWHVLKWFLRMFHNWCFSKRVSFNCGICQTFS